MRPRQPSVALLARDGRGVVMVEFLIAFVPLFVLFLATTQLALIGVAELIVRHAAFAGVRSAVVVLDDDPRYYGGVARCALTGSGADTRAAAIRRSVELRLAAIAPALLHTSDAGTAVTFPVAPGSATLFDTRVEPGPTVTLRVTHVFACVVPIAAALLCHRRWSGAGKGRLARVLEAEATLPSQRAGYLYESEREETR